MPAGRPAKPAPLPPTVNVRIPRELWERLKAEAAAMDPRVSPPALLESWMERCIAEADADHDPDAT